MKIIFISLLSILNTCISTDPVRIVEYKQENCSTPLHEPILINATSNFEELTICAKFSLKFLKGTYFMELISSSSNLTLFAIFLDDFSKNFGFVIYLESYYMFQWSEQEMKPDTWQQICTFVSNTQIVVAFNGNLILNESTITTTQINVENKQAYLHLGGSYEGSSFVGYMTKVYLWNQKFEITDLIYMTNSCSLIDAVPDLFSWDSFKVSFIQKLQYR